MSETEILNLPSSYSSGKITVYRSGGSSPSDVIDARGSIALPEDAIVFLDLSQEVCDDLTRIRSIPERLITGRISLLERNLDRTDFAHLDMQQVRFLVISFCNGIRLEQLRQLQSTSSLQHLNLSYTPISPPVFSWILQFPRLETLNLSGAEIDDDSLGLVTQLNELEHLHLAQTKITDHGIDTCWRLPSLKSIDVSECRVGDGGLENFHRSGVRSIRFNGTLLSDHGVEVIVRAVLREGREMDYLGLESCNITDAGLVHLSSLHGLKYIDLSGTSVTPGGIAFLKKSLPDCIVSA